MILTTEPPALPRLHLGRPRLAQHVLAHGVTIIQGPAGYGKSVLLAEVLRAVRSPMVLCEVDAAAREPGHLLAGLEEAAAALGRSGSGVLALDRLEVLLGADDAWAALSQWIATRLPASCRLVLAGRALGRLPALSPWRLAGDLARVGTRELCFAAEESRAYLTLLGAPESEELRAAHGWPAALRLLATGGESARGEINEYMASQVVAGIPPEERDLLTDLAVWPDWTADVCNRLLERADGERLLASWANSLPVDGQGRVHPLVRDHFASFLGRDPSRRRRMHRRAALLAVERSQQEDALAHALRADDLGLMVPLLRQVVGRLAASGSLDALDGWLSKAPAAALEAAPELLLTAGEALRRGGHPRRGLRWLQTAAVGFAAGGQADGLLRAFCRLALAHADLGEWSEVEAAIEQVEAELSGASGRDRAEALRTVAEYHLWAGQCEAAAGELREAARLFQAHRDRESAGQALFLLGAGALVALDREDEALAALRESQALLGGAAGCDALLAEADILLELGRGPEAEVLLATADPRSPEQRARLCWAWARLELQRGDIAAAQRYVIEGEAQSAGLERSPGLTARATLLEGWLALAEGAADRALALGRKALGFASEHRTLLPLVRYLAQRLVAGAGVARPAIRVECLGTFRLYAGDREVPLSHWGRAQVRAILQYLLLQPGFAAPRELLLETLWPNESPEQARARLRVLLNRLRQALLQLGCTLEASADIIRIPMAAVASVDLLSFRSALQDARRLLTHAPEACLDACRSGRALYRGSLLEDAFWPGVETYRLQAQRELVELLELWQKAAMRLGREEEAITALEELLAVDPGHEEAARTLMTQLSRRGRRGEAAQLYRRLARWLKEELGLDPSPETEALYRQVLR